ncbi:magnesium transporter CorA family protein [Fluviispira sanaruensis]|uniref:Cobalt/magnesium transport protein CorA n=1 Tax=Fluviispira sanaruensis TaxID=2493639 RepID=A0A4P2VJR2_FLUSA|nr:CorA family divalent cation transporter [Fluviispira sanaruensis]BBH52778.1 cobalt/magnesium transport protein CorA [Fluviispira sanaruensis]
MSEVILSKKFQGRNYIFEELILSKIPQEAYVQMQGIGTRFKLHYLTVEDCVHRDQRTKVESFGEYHFIVWYYFHPSLEKPIELHIVLGKDFLLLIANETPHVVAIDWKMLCFPKGQSIFLNDAICQMFDVLVEHSEMYVGALEYGMHMLEKRIVARHINPTKMLRMKYLVNELEQTVGAINSIFHQLEKIEFNLDQKFRMRNIVDHHNRLSENVMHLRFQSMALMDIYYGSSGERSNQQMRKLTMLSAYLLPMSVLAGIFGMNFEGMPFKHDIFMYIGFLLIFGTPLSIFLFFVYKKIYRKKIKNMRKLHDEKHSKHYPFLKRRMDYSNYKIMNESKANTTKKKTSTNHHDNL